MFRLSQHRDYKCMVTWESAGIGKDLQTGTFFNYVPRKWFVNPLRGRQSGVKIMEQTTLLPIGPDHLDTSIAPLS